MTIDYARLHEIRNEKGKNTAHLHRMQERPEDYAREEIDGALRRDRELREAEVLELAKSPGNVLRSTPYGADTSAPPAGSAPAARQGDDGGLLSRSLSSVERLHGAGALPERAAVKAEQLARVEGRPAQAWLVATSDPAYSSAFARMVADPSLGFSEFDESERAAWRRVREVQRAMEIGSGAGGGFMVPAHLDPAILLTSDGSINPLRRISRTVQIATSRWNGVSSEGVTSEWLPEHQEAADATPDLGQPFVDVHKGAAFVPFSLEWEGDASSALTELARLLRDGADQLQAEAFTNGTGPDTPLGVLTGATEEVDTGGAFDAADVYALQEALPPRFQANAQWTAHLAVVNALAQFETGNGARLFPEVEAGRLLRRPLNENSNQSGDMATTGSKFLLYGDFSQFLIADRVGTTLEIVPHLFGAARRPTGQRGAWMWFRTGSDVLVPEAFRLLNKTA